MMGGNLSAQSMGFHSGIVSLLLSAFVVHFIFKRWEPLNIPLNTALLLGVPCIFAALLSTHLLVHHSIALSFGLFYVTLFSSIALYRISRFHPLARYPGPFFAKLSKWWLVYRLQGAGTLGFARDLHDRYGDVVRIGEQRKNPYHPILILEGPLSSGPNEISIRDVSAVFPLMGAHGLPKAASWAGRSMHQPIPSLVSFRDPVEHAKRRRPWNRAFSVAARKEYFPSLQKRVAQFVTRVADEKGVFDLAMLITRYSYDFMGDMVFGGGFELLRDGDPDQLIAVIQRGLSEHVIYAELPWISYYTKRIPRASSGSKSLRSIAIARCRDRYNTGSTSKDLFYYLNNEDGAENVSPSAQIVISDGVLGLVAGSGTTASALCRTFRYLLLFPEIYQKLQREIDKFYPPGEDCLDSQHHKDMWYLEGVINECLRMSPIFNGGSERAPWVGHGDVAFGQYYIPEGTTARVCTIAMHYDPRYWYQPNVFWPERWAIAEGILPAPKGFVHNPVAFLPFSVGPANCVGKAVAMLNMRMVLCHVLQNLDIRMPDGMGRAEWIELLSNDGRPLPVQIRKRE